LDNHSQEKQYDFNPFNLPAGVLQAIGLVTASAAQTESVVEMAIAGCLGVDMELGGAVATHMNAQLRDHVLRSVAEIRIDDLDALDELDDLLDAIKSAQSKRNAVVHQTWCTDPETGDVFRVAQTSRGSFDIDVVPLSSRDIEEDALLIYTAGMDLIGFLDRYGLLPDPPPDNRPRHHKTKGARKSRQRP